MNFSKNKLIISAMMFLNKFSCRQSNLIITVVRALAETIHNRFKRKRVSKTVMINNWIDEKEIYPVEETHLKVTAFKEKYGLNDKFVIMYS